MNKNLFLIEEYEKRRILEMHQRATKKQYLPEQIEINNNPIYDDFYSKLGDKSKRYWDGTDKNVPKMTDEEKNNILEQTQKKIDRAINARESQGKKKTTQNDIFDSIKSITITYDGTPIQSSETKQEIVITETPYVATYPDIQSKNPELENFYFDDNQVVVPEANVDKFRTMINELKNQIPSNETITEIVIKAGSTTSQVPTKYKGGAYETIEEGQQNNIKLAADRCENIESTLNRLIGEVFPSEISKVRIEKRDLKPNNGPAYTETERSEFFGTGKLDPAKKSEYEEKYGPYKGSYGSVMIVTKGTTNTNIGGGGSDIVNVNKWGVRFNYKSIKGSSNKKMKYKGSTGGGISVGGKKGLALADCPLW